MRLNKTFYLIILISTIFETLLCFDLQRILPSTNVKLAYGVEVKSSNGWARRRGMPQKVPKMVVFLNFGATVISY